MSLYLEAAAILQSPQNSSLKAIIYNPQKPFKSPQPKLYALIAETLKFQDIIKEVIENAGILKLERKLTPLLSLLLVHDLLLARSGIATSDGPLKDAVMRHKARLTAEFTRARIKRGHADVKSLKDAVNAQHARESEDGVVTTETGLTTFNPRWIRVNTLKTSLDQVLASPKFRQFEEVSATTDMYFHDRVQKYYYRKPGMLPDIFAVHLSHDVTSNELYKSGMIILQSASSCLPAVMLNPPPGATVVDGCAAPGNKTTHLASLVGRKGKVFAVERDKYRAEVLDKMVKKAGADDIVTVLKATDFTTIREGHEAWDAEYLLLDPSCSGSGILQRIDYDITKLNLPSAEAGQSQASRNTRKRKRDDKKKEDNSAAQEKEVEEQQDIAEEKIEVDATKERLQSLSDFQLAIILHAFSFPNARRITYSTCSIHAEENEHVVVRALNSAIAKSRGWTVQSREDNPLDEWGERGIRRECEGLKGASAEEQTRVAEGCVRVRRTQSLGGGFFVACFIRDVGPEAIPCVSRAENNRSEEVYDEEAFEDEWTGFADTEEPDATAAPKPEVSEPPKKKKKKQKQKGEVKVNRQFQKAKKGWS